MGGEFDPRRPGWRAPETWVCGGGLVVLWLLAVLAVAWAEGGDTKRDYFDPRWDGLSDRCFGPGEHPSNAALVVTYWNSPGSQGRFRPTAFETCAGVVTYRLRVRKGHGRGGEETLILVDWPPDLTPSTDTLDVIDGEQGEIAFWRGMS